MNVLAGKATYGTMTGKIEINGRPDSVFNYSSLCGFVPQDDTMLRDLTIKENLMFYARIRLPASYSDSQCLTIVKDTMSTLGLTHIQDSEIGDATKRGISGGQLKRVNVAMEMVSSPSVLFLDEPTSGLDSTTSFELVEALKVLASKGTNILVVLHQPSYQLFELFDDCLLLGKGGSTVYLGESAQCLEYFRSIGFECGLRVNPADFFMDVIAGKCSRKNDPKFKGTDLFKMWEKNHDQKSYSCKQLSIDLERTDSAEANEPSRIVPLGKTVSVEPRARITDEALAKVAPAGFWKSLMLFMHRALIQYRKGKMTFLGDLFLQTTTGFVCGGIYKVRC